METERKYFRLNLQPEDVTSLNALIKMVCKAKKHPYQLRQIQVGIPRDFGMVDTSQITMYGSGYSSQVITLLDAGPDDYSSDTGLMSLMLESNRQSGHDSIVDYDWKNEEAKLIPQSEPWHYGVGECLVERTFDRRYDDAVKYMNDASANNIEDLAVGTDEELSPFDVITRLIQHDNAAVTIEQLFSADYCGERLSKHEPKSHNSAQLRLIEKLKGTKPLSTDFKLGVFSLLAVAGNEEAIDLAYVLSANYDHQHDEVQDLNFEASIKEPLTSTRIPSISPIWELFGDAIAKIGY
jgi:hypothetical protein